MAATVDDLLVTIREKDELIRALMEALEEEERKRKELERALTLLGEDNGEDILNRLNAWPPQHASSGPAAAGRDLAEHPLSEPLSDLPGSPDEELSPGLYDDDWPDVPSSSLNVMPQQPPLVEGPRDQQEASGDVLVLNQSTGIFDDQWINAKSSLAISQSFMGRKVTLTFYLPALQGSTSKLLRLKPNFADAVEIEVPRGSPAAYTCIIPQLAKFTPRINVDTEAEPKNGPDRRNLGVVLVSAQPEP